MNSFLSKRRAVAAALLSAVLILLLGSQPAAHDVPNEVIVHAFVKPEGDRLHLVVRVPLILLIDMDLPKRGPGYLALRYVDSALEATVAETAAVIDLYENGRRLTSSHGEARISLPSSKSFATYDEAVAHIRGPQLPVETNLFWNQGFFDAYLQYPIHSDRSEFALQVGIAPGLGDSLKTIARFLPPDGSTRAYELIGQAGRVNLDPRWHQAAWVFVKSGFFHILDGIDHLLFLLCVIIPFRRFRSLLLVVTSFTVAHSVTLIAAAYGVTPTGAWFPVLVETLIAASIVYMALENIVAANLRRRWLITFAFGLVHGFAFSFALRETLQFAGSHLLVSLLSFNVGVEVGQVLVLALSIPALTFLFRRVVAERLGTVIVSVLVAHTAWHWMVDRGATLALVQWPSPVAVLTPTSIRVLLVVLLAGGLVWLARGPWRQPVEALLRQARPWRASARIAEPD